MYCCSNVSRDMSCAYLRFNCEIHTLVFVLNSVHTPFLSLPKEQSQYGSCLAKSIE